MKKLLISSIMLATTAWAGTASAYNFSGNFTIQNQSSVQVQKTVVTYPAGSITIPATIIATSNGYGYLNLSTSSTVFSNSFTYENAARNNGCIFTTLGIYNKITNKFSYTFSATPSAGSTTAQCQHTGSVNSDGSFNSTATILPKF